MRKATEAQIARKRENERRSNLRIFGCAICRKSSHGFGNNAWPIVEGTCCASCNENVVIPARFERITTGWSKQAGGA
jgi:hypothetical protein